MAGVDDPVASPSELVQGYLKSKGLQATSENVRRTLEQAARDPTFMPALRTQEPPQDTAPPSQRTRSAAAEIEQPPQATGSRGADLTKVAGADEVGWKPGETPDTSAPPSGGGMDLGNIGQAILAGLGGAGLGAAGAYPFLDRILGRGGAAPGTPDATGGAAAGDRYQVLPNQAEQSPMQIALDKATAPQAVPRLGSDVPDVSGIRPVVQPSDVMGRPGLPPGVSDIDAVNAGRGMQGVTGSSMPVPGEGNIPLRPRVSVQEIPRPAVRSPYVPRLLLR